MEQYFDIRTLSLVTGLVAVNLSIAMVYVVLRRKAYPGFLEWTIATFANSLGMILLGLRHFLPDIFSVVFANLFILSYFIFLARGLHRFAGIRQLLCMDIATGAITAAVFLLFTVPFPSINIRIIILSFMIFLFCFRCFWVVWKHLPAVLPGRHIFFLATLAVSGLWNMWREIYTILMEGSIPDFMSAGVIQALSFIVMLSINIALTMLLIISNSHRLEVDLRKANEKIRTLSGLLPICSACKKIKNDAGEWMQIESYISGHSPTRFTHSICPECKQELYPDVE